MTTTSYTVEITVGDHCIYFARGNFEANGYYTPLEFWHQCRVRVLEVSGDYATITLDPNPADVPPCYVHIRRLLPGPGEDAR